MAPDPSAEQEHVRADVLPAAAQPGPQPGPQPAERPAAPEELCELAQRLLERGEAAQAADVFTAALDRLGAGDPARGQLLGGLGMARLDQALTAFAEAAGTGDRGVRPLALELLARALPLRDRDEEAAETWQRGMTDPDPDVAAAVRARLRRGFGADGGPGQEYWWDDFVESAVAHGTLPVLTAELFSAIDHMYALAAVPHVRKARQRELWDALAQAVQVPGAYAWGPALQDSFRIRLDEAIGPT